MLVSLIALFGLLGLMAGLAVYLIKQQKQADGVGAGQQPEAAAPRVSGFMVVVSPVFSQVYLHHSGGTAAASVPGSASSPPDVHIECPAAAEGWQGRP